MAETLDELEVEIEKNALVKLEIQLSVQSILYNEKDENVISAIESLRIHYKKFFKVCYEINGILCIKAADREENEKLFYIGIAPKIYLGKKVERFNRIADLEPH